jgi:Rod binding domain-containing protein
MAIKPPSDIILEVSQAADPERIKVAAAKLEKLGESAGTAFAQVMDKIENAPSKSPTPDPGGPLRPSLPFDVARARTELRNDVTRLQNATQTASAGTDRAKAMQDFEAVVLQSFISSMLPENAENVYGEGTAGSVWKSMLSEQISKQMAKSGGIGIAKHILASNSLPMGGTGRPQSDVSGLPPASLSAVLAASSRI